MTLNRFCSVCGHRQRVGHACGGTPIYCPGCGAVLPSCLCDAPWRKYVAYGSPSWAAEELIRVQGVDMGRQFVRTHMLASGVQPSRGRKFWMSVLYMLSDADDPAPAWRTPAGGTEP